LTRNPLPLSVITGIGKQNFLCHSHFMFPNSFYQAVAYDYVERGLRVKPAMTGVWLLHRLACDKQLLKDNIWADLNYSSRPLGACLLASGAIVLVIVVASLIVVVIVHG